MNQLSGDGDVAKMYSVTWAQLMGISIVCAQICGWIPSVVEDISEKVITVMVQYRDHTLKADAIEVKGLIRNSVGFAVVNETVNYVEVGANSHIEVSSIDT